MQEKTKEKRNKDTQFLDLLMRNQKRIYNFILLLVPNYSDADDLMQETVSVMWSKFDSYEPGTHFTAWAIKIARYKIYNYRRKSHRHALQFSEESMDMIMQASSAVFERRQDRVTALQQCLLNLPEHDRKLITLRYERDMPFKNISELTGRSINGLYHTMARIHKLLLRCVHKTLALGGAV